MKIKKNRNQIVAITMTEEEKQQIKTAAKNSEQTISNYCRKRLFPCTNEYREN